MKTLAIWSPRPDAMVSEAISPSITLYGLPVITIKPKIFDTTALTEAEALIFVSHHAVKHFFLHAPNDIRSNRILIAIGERTAKTLRQHGFSTVLTTPPPYNSEALLADETFKKLACKQFVIISGTGGRSLLQDELQNRGKTVFRIESYQRDKANLLPQHMVQFLNEHAIGGIVLSSGEISDAVAHVLIQANLRQAFDLPVFTLSERIALRAEQLGFRQVYSTAQASQHFLYQRIIHWWEGELQ